MDRHSEQEPKMEDLPEADGEELRVEQGPSRRVGKAIAEAREAKGLSQADLAQSLNLDLRVIELIEADRLDEAPEPIYVRAYLKSWAGMLGLDADQLVSDYDKQRSTPERQAIRANSRKTLAVMDEGRGSGVKSRAWRWLLALILLALVALVAAQLIPAQWRVWMGQGNPGESTLSGPKGSQTLPLIRKQTEVPTPPGMPAESGSEGQSSSAQSGLPAKPLSAISTPAHNGVAQPQIPAQGPVADADESGAGAQQQAAAAPSASQASEPAASAGDNLVIKAQGSDCWVEVKNAAGTRLMYDVLKSGQERRFGGQGPFSVVLGNPNAVKVLWHGKPVALSKPNNTTGVVRIKVGG